MGPYGVIHEAVKIHVVAKIYFLCLIIENPKIRCQINIYFRGKTYFSFDFYGKFTFSLEVKGHYYGAYV